MNELDHLPHAAPDQHYGWGGQNLQRVQEGIKGMSLWSNQSNQKHKAQKTPYSICAVREEGVWMLPPAGLHRLPLWPGHGVTSQYFEARPVKVQEGTKGI